MPIFLLLTSVFLITLQAANLKQPIFPIRTRPAFCIVIKLSPSKSPFGWGEAEWAALLAVSRVTDMKARPCLVLNAAGDYPACAHMGEWDALCTTQQRAFHGQSADPLTGVQLRQCNPKLFNQITRAWGKSLPLNDAWGGSCSKIWVPVCDNFPSEMLLSITSSANVISISGEGQGSTANHAL